METKIEEDVTVTMEPRVYIQDKALRSIIREYSEDRATEVIGRHILSLMNRIERLRNELTD